jgi:membrane fusion protein (multidrug efflux system)
MSELIEGAKQEARGPIMPGPFDGEEADEEFSPIPPPAGSRRWLKIVIGVAILGIVAAIAVHYYFYAIAHESTDDAFIEGHIVPISAKVASYVSRLHVDDNVHIKQGDLLVELDARDFEARLAQARANLAAARARHRSAEVNVKLVNTTSGAGVDLAKSGLQAAERQIDGARSRMEQARAQVAAAQAEATRASEDAQRYERLLQYHAVSRQERDNAVAADRAAEANLEAARQAQQAAGDNLRRAESQLGEAKARLDSAKSAPSRVALSRVQVDTTAAEIAQAEAKCARRNSISPTAKFTPQRAERSRARELTREPTCKSDKPFSRLCRTGCGCWQTSKKRSSAI